MSTSIIFFDVDGTIIDEDGIIPDSAIDAIQNCRENGNLCIVNTGRPFSHINENVIKIGFDGYICSCGQHVIVDGRTLYRNLPETDICRQMIELIKECNLTGYFESEEGFGYYLAEEDIEKELRNNIETYSNRIDLPKLDIDSEGRRFDKFCVWAGADSDIERFKNIAGRQFTVTPREHHMFECNIRGFSKETGLNAVIDYYNIPFENTFAIGDSTNDLSMFRRVKHSIAMGNAAEEVKNEAEFVTRSIDNDGLMYALEKLIQ